MDDLWDWHCQLRVFLLNVAYCYEVPVSRLMQHSSGGIVIWDVTGGAAVVALCASLSFCPLLLFWICLNA